MYPCQLLMFRDLKKKRGKQYSNTSPIRRVKVVLWHELCVQFCVGTDRKSLCLESFRHYGVVKIF